MSLVFHISEVGSDKELKPSVLLGYFVSFLNNQPLVETLIIVDNQTVARF